MSNDKMREALERVLSWDWDGLRRSPSHPDWASAFQDMDDLAFAAAAAPAGEQVGLTDAALSALRDAATSLETISRLAGRKTYGRPPIETFMDSFADVRAYAASRASVARAVIAAHEAKRGGA